MSRTNCKYEFRDGSIVECRMSHYCDRCDNRDRCEDKQTDSNIICNSILRANCKRYPYGCEKYSSEIWDEYAPENYYAGLEEEEIEGISDDIFNSYDD